jgi:hypothetical protein
MPNGGTALTSALIRDAVKDKSEWKIAAYHNTDVKSDVPAPDPQ